MGGGLMQLVAQGTQDDHLTGNPQITFFKFVGKRHTNFSIESIKQSYTGTTITNGQCTAAISRNGDLVSRLYLDVKGKTGGTDSRNPGSEFLKRVSVKIGGQEIDRHSGLWLETWAELTQPNPSGTVVDIVAKTASGNGTPFQNMAGMGGVVEANNLDVHLQVPLQFWFCKNAGQALPLIALQYHVVEVEIEHTIATTFNGGSISHDLWADYVYLDTEERRRFASSSHEYLIEQVQEQALSADTRHQLNFNHPVKELIWTTAGATSGSVARTSLLKPCNALTDTFILKLNSQDRFAAREAIYFSRAQVWEHHSGHGGLDSSTAVATGGSNDSICVYSFALKPEDLQPSGTCNFSRLDRVELVSSVAVPANTVIFAVNYNVLRVMSGMGGLAYSN